MTLLERINAAIKEVARGEVQRVCEPGRFVVFLKDGEAKPRLRVFK